MILLLNRRLHTWFVGLVFTFLILVLNYFSLSSTTALHQITPLFEDDTCTPPCWFGLTPGYSTREDVENTLPRYSDLFEYEQLGDGFTLFWREISRTDWQPTQAYLGFEDDILSEIRVAVNQRVTYQEAERRLGIADDVRLYTYSGEQWSFGGLYFTEGVIVEAFADGAECQMEDLGQMLVVTDLFYTPLRQENELPYSYEYYISVPADVSRSWMNGEIEGDCNSILSEFLRSPSSVATSQALSTRAAATRTVSIATRDAQSSLTRTANALTWPTDIPTPASTPLPN